MNSLENSSKMPVLVAEIWIKASPQRCFDAARDIGLHCQTAAFTKEEVVAGVTKGLIGLGESVTFAGVHFGIRQRLTAQIIEFEPPIRFVDKMTRGAFQSLTHLHQFEPQDGGTLMRDTLDWTAPLGILGRLADWLFLKRHMKNFLEKRNAAFKEILENEK